MKKIALIAAALLVLGTATAYAFNAFEGGPTSGYEEDRPVPAAPEED